MTPALVRPVVSIQALRPTGGDLYNYGLYDTAVYGSDVDWEDVSAFLRETSGGNLLDCNMGTENELDQAGASTLSFSMLFEASLTDVVDFIKYGARVIYSVVVGSESYPRFYGTIVEYSHEEVADHLYYRIRCADGFERMTREPTMYGLWPDLTLPGAAITYVLDNIGWVDGRLLDVGVNPLGQPSADGEEPVFRIDKIAVSDFGHTFIDRIGRFRFISRTVRFARAADPPDVNLDVIPHDKVRFTTDDRSFLTRTTVRSDYCSVTTINTDLETAVGRFPKDIETYLKNATDMVSYGEWMTGRYQGQEERISSVNIPLGDVLADAMDVADLDQWDRVDVEGAEYFAIGIKEVWRTAARWSVALVLTPIGIDFQAGVYDSGLYDSAVYGW